MNPNPILITFGMRRSAKREQKLARTLSGITFYCSWIFLLCAVEKKSPFLRLNKTIRGTRVVMEFGAQLHATPHKIAFQWISFLPSAHRPNSNHATWNQSGHLMQVVDFRAVKWDGYFRSTLLAIWAHGLFVGLIAVRPIRRCANPPPAAKHSANLFLRSSCRPLELRSNTAITSFHSLGWVKHASSYPAQN
jgi:hypothetical protein